MARKSESDPRRLYARKGLTHVCFGGTYFGTRSESKMDLSLPAKVEGAGEGKVRVTQRRPHAKSVVEVWSRCKV